MNPLICDLTRQGARNPVSLYLRDTGAPSDLCSLEAVALFSSLGSEDFCLVTNLLQFQKNGPFKS